VASLKRLNSVAHSLAHQFASTLNYWHNDYAICHLARASKSLNIPKIDINVLVGQATPHEIEIGFLPEIISKLKPALEVLLEKEGYPVEIVTAATLNYNFDVDRTDLLFHQPTYDCTCTLTTQDGRTYKAQLTERSN
jgi:hypothetical protein